jgi:coenzyme F420-reducing hydrogenase beta subunit
MHTIVAYLFLSFGEDEQLIFKDTEMQVTHRVEWREIESIQISKGKVMLYCKGGKSQNQHDLGVKPFNAQTCELLCNALQNCYNRHFKRIAHQSLS